VKEKNGINYKPITKAYQNHFPLSLQRASERQKKEK
jgi:hypothetical protein